MIKNFIKFSFPLMILGVVLIFSGILYVNILGVVIFFVGLLLPIFEDPDAPRNESNQKL